MPTLSRGSLLVALALALTFAAGCGDDGGGDAFVDDANQVCKDSKEEIEAAGSDRDKLVAAGDGYVADLKEVDASGDKESDYNEWVASQEEYFADFKTALRSGDQAKVDALDSSKGDSQARELGLDDCLG